MDLLSSRRALTILGEFRNTYVEFVSARRRGDLDAAWAAQQRMARLTHPAQHALDGVGCGYVILCDAPAMGGRRHPAEITGVATHDTVADDYHVSPRSIVLQIEIAIGEYERRVETGRWQLLNPLWWLREILAGIVRIPFYLLGVAGLNQDAAEASLVGRAYRRLATFMITAVGLIASLEQLGWLSPLKRWAALHGVTLPLP